MAKKILSKSTAKKAISKLGVTGIIIVLIIAITVVALAFSPVGKAAADFIKKNYLTKVEVLTSNFDPITIGDAKLKVHFIDVNQGDAIYIELPDGKDMLIDGGSKTPVAVRTEFVDYIANLKGSETKLDYLVVTHPDTDHYNMLKPILETYEIKNIYYHDVEKNNTYKGYMGLFDVEGATLHKTGPNATSGVWKTIKYEDATNGYTINMYSIGYDTLNTENPDEYDADESNGMSIMMSIKYNNRKIMLTGDAVIETEEWLMPFLSDTYDCDVLKLGHHGSSTSTSAEFLDKIKPEYAIVSSDDGKAHDHPRPMVMNRLYERGIVTYSTNHHGHIVLEIDEDGEFGFRTQNVKMVQNNTLPRDPRYIAP